MVVGNLYPAGFWRAGEGYGSRESLSCRAVKRWRGVEVQKLLG